jgi:putative membrane protein
MALVWQAVGMTRDTARSKEPLVLFGLAGLLLVVSGIGPVDRLTWVLEVAPVAIGIPLLFRLRPRWPFTPLLYRLLFIHALILMLGGHYTYAEAPPGFWVRDWLDLSRNHYDRLGHFAQGFIPAILMREILWRASPLRGSRWLPFLVVCFCLAFSAFYEFIEWWGALIMGEAADAFLATQGDVWDTQWDMFLAMCGAIIALLVLTRMHDRQLKALGRHGG